MNLETIPADKLAASLSALAESYEAAGRRLQILAARNWGARNAALVWRVAARKFEAAARFHGEGHRERCLAQAASFRGFAADAEAEFRRRDLAEALEVLSAEI